jgi:hypothetical protein
MAYHAVLSCGNKKGDTGIMIWLAGLLGFVCGFMLGLMLLNYLLKARPAKELLENKSLRRRYGLFAWLIAGFGACVAVRLYEILLVLG